MVCSVSEVMTLTTMPISALLSPRRRTAALVFGVISTTVVATRSASAVFLAISFGQKGSEAAVAAKSAASTIALSVALATILAVSLIGFFIARNITRPIGEAVTAATRLADGDLTLEVSSQSKDETSQLLGAMQRTITKLSEVVAEVNGGAARRLQGGGCWLDDFGRGGEGGARGRARGRPPMQRFAGTSIWC